MAYVSAVQTGINSIGGLGWMGKLALELELWSRDRVNLCQFVLNNVLQRHGRGGSNAPGYVVALSERATATSTL